MADFNSFFLSREIFDETSGVKIKSVFCLIAFKINNKGNVVNIKVKKVPHPRIEKEVVRVMKMLPTMKPGRQRGRAIGVSYNFPLTFIVEEKSKKNN